MFTAFCNNNNAVNSFFSLLRIAHKFVHGNYDIEFNNSKIVGWRVAGYEDCIRLDPEHHKPYICKHLHCDTLRRVSIRDQPVYIQQPNGVVKICSRLQPPES